MMVLLLLSKSKSGLALGLFFLLLLLAVEEGWLLACLLCFLDGVGGMEVEGGEVLVG